MLGGVSLVTWYMLGGVSLVTWYMLGGVSLDLGSLYPASIWSFTSLLLISLYGYPPAD